MLLQKEMLPPWCMWNCKHIVGWALTDPDEFLEKMFFVFKLYIYLDLLDNNIYIPLPSGFFPSSYEKSFLDYKIFT